MYIFYYLRNIIHIICYWYFISNVHMNCLLIGIRAGSVKNYIMCKLELEMLDNWWRFLARLKHFQECDNLIVTIKESDTLAEQVWNQVIDTVPVLYYFVMQLITCKVASQAFLELSSSSFLWVCVLKRVN